MKENVEMLPMKTAQELAETFRASPAYTQSDLPTLARRLRHLSTLGLIHADQTPRDRRGTEQFSVTEGCIARLLSFLMEMSFDGRILEGIAAGLRSPRPSGVAIEPNAAGELTEVELWPHGKPEHHFSNLVESVSAGEPWFIAVRAFNQLGRPVVSARFQIGMNPATDSSEAIAVRASQEMESHGQPMLIAVNPLVAPIIAAFRSEG